jgi:hypothetical protein
MFKGNANDELKLIAIKTKSKVYITDNIENDSYHHCRLQNYLFDGNTPSKTYKSDWFEIQSIPTTVERLVPKQVIRSWYELSEKYYNTGLPKQLNKSDFDESSEYESVYGLYERKQEFNEGGLESIPFKLNIIEELDEFQITRNEFALQHSILDRITTHPILLTLKPCKLSRKESYNIVRKYIKTNIDLKYAVISSDYDFCLTVEKKISHDPIGYQVNVGKRKPRYETRFNRSRTIKVYETSPEGYSKYPTIEPFEGKNEDDLKQNIQLFLDELMEAINKPYVECKHCEGKGVVLDEIQK